MNSLSAPLLDYVDEGTLAFNPAVEVSYLDPADQQVVYEIMERDQISPSLSQAQKLHKLAQIGKISEDAIEAVMTVEGLQSLTSHRDQPECIDHIALTEGFAGSTEVKIAEWNQSKTLSDHKGIAVSF